MLLEMKVFSLSNYDQFAGRKNDNAECCLRTCDHEGVLNHRRLTVTLLRALSAQNIEYELGATGDSKFLKNPEQMVLDGMLAYL